MASPVDVCIVGAGPYGLSIAAHLRGKGIAHRIFGRPLQTWLQHMPQGMLLKSDGFASNLSAPEPGHSLRSFCSQRGIPYDDTHIPVRLETFVQYGLDFQKHLVPEVDTRSIVKITRHEEIFILEVEDGEQFTARRVVLAVGIRDYAWTPPQLRSLPRTLFTHSSDHSNPSAFAGRNVTVIGGGASAIDLAALLSEIGAKVCIVARRPAITFHNPPAPGEQSFLSRLKSPSSGLGPGWKSRLYTELPYLFRLLPAALRLRIVRSHLGPAPGWPMKERVSKVQMYLGTRDLTANPEEDHVLLRFLGSDGRVIEHRTDHVIAATGYRPNMNRLKFLAPDIQAGLRTLENSPVLSAHFESSVPGLYFVGISSANTFGPMMRFAFGADWTARHLTAHLEHNAAMLKQKIFPHTAEVLD